MCYGGGPSARTRSIHMNEDNFFLSLVYLIFVRENNREKKDFSIKKSFILLFNHILS